MRVGWLLMWLWAGCYLSVPYEYTPNKPRLTQAETHVTVAVAPFVDARAPLRGSSFFNRDPSLYYYRDDSRGLHGLTHNGAEFTPPAIVLRDLLVQELSGVGAPSVVLGTSAADPLAVHCAAANAAGAPYVLTAEVKEFSLVVRPPSALLAAILEGAPGLNLLINQSKARYAVEYTLSLYRSSDGEKVWDQRFVSERTVPAKRLKKMQRVMFGEVLPQVNERAIGYVTGQADLDARQEAEKKLSKPTKPAKKPKK